MDFFSDALARLKHQLRVSKDGEVASALGLSKTAFSERKKRGSFPEKELRALAQGRPDLEIDVDYVLTGRTAEFDRRLDILKAVFEEVKLPGLDEAEQIRLRDILLLSRLSDVEGLKKALAPAEADARDLDADTRHAIEMAGDELLRQNKIVTGKKLLELVEAGRRYIRHARELERRKAEAKEEAPHETRRRKAKTT